MDIEEIRELVRLMVDNDLAELDVTDGENKIRLRRGADNEPAPVGAVLPIMQPVAAQAAPVEPAGAEPAPPEKEDLVEIKSPMVGTFYRTASPDSDPYVAVGSAVAEDTLVCIVEAMKVMNEIKAECDGTIVEVCVRNAQPVEYGQTLFKVKPS